MARVSVLMPTYEPEAAHVREAVESVLAQTEKDWTLLIHDDASTRDVSAIVAPYLHDRRVTFARSPYRLGIGGNWNACVERTDAPVVQFLFQDDAWTPRALEHGLHALDAHPSVSMVSLQHRYVFEGKPISSGPYDEVERGMRSLPGGLINGEEFFLRWLHAGLRPNVIGEPSFVMLRREIFARTGAFHPTMQQMLDADMWVRCLLHGDWFRVTDDCGFFRVHAKAASARNEETGAGLSDRLEIFERLLRNLPRGELRNATVAARTRAVQDMAAKFIARRKSGKAVGGGSAGKAKQFAMKHPLLVGRALLAAMLKKS